MASAETYSLWLRPMGDIAFSLQQRIQKLSKKHSTPLFEPHVTLLGGLQAPETELINLTEALGSSFRPFDILLTRAETGTTFYQSLFVKIKETRPLMEARAKAEQLFDYSTDKEDYFPHLSLMYCDFPREEKERILNAMGREFHIRFNVQNLLLMKTTGKPDDWKKIHAVEFEK